MLLQDIPDDYVIGSEPHNVKKLVEEAFGYVNLAYVELDPRYFRPTEANDLIAGAAKYGRKLGWEAKIKVRGTSADHG